MSDAKIAFLKSKLLTWEMFFIRKHSFSLQKGSENKEPLLTTCFLHYASIVGIHMLVEKTSGTHVNLS